MGALIDSDGRVRFADFDAVYEWSSIEQLAVDYWHWQRLPSKEKDRDPMVAWSCIDVLMSAPAPRALDVIDAILALASDDDELCGVGAGPLEDLLSHNGHGQQFAAEVAARARSSSRLRKALSCLWLSNDVPAEVRQLLEPAKWAW
jgi:hypothetical protein